MKTRKTYTVQPWFYNFFAMHKYQKSKTTFKLSLNSHVYWNTLYVRSIASELIDDQIEYLKGNVVNQTCIFLINKSPSLVI